MQTHTGYANTKPPTTSYSPSVPLYVYRELSAELQAVQAKLDVVTAQNQKLVQENQLLRQEVAKVVQSFAYLQKLVETPSIPNHQPAPPHQGEKVHIPKPSHPEARQRQPVAQPTRDVAVQPQRREEAYRTVNHHFPASQTVYIEEQEVRYYPSGSSEVKEISGWWLVLIIVLIMITGFSAGYFFVRPFLQNQNQSG
jgi:uncharacterized membrane protein